MEYKQTFIINDDLKMSKGKIPVQVAHGEAYYVNMIKNLSVLKERTKYTQYVDDIGDKRIKTFDEWFGEDGGLMKKVVLKATEQEMDRIYQLLNDKNIWVCKVHDAGFTQVPAGSFTCLVVEPITDDQYDEIFRHLKLL